MKKGQVTKKVQARRNMAELVAKKLATKLNAGFFMKGINTENNFKKQVEINRLTK